MKKFCESCSAPLKYNRMKLLQDPKLIACAEVEIRDKRKRLEIKKIKIKEKLER